MKIPTEAVKTEVKESLCFLRTLWNRVFRSHPTTVYHNKTPLKTWFQVNWLSIKITTRVIFFEADTRTVRAMLAAASYAGALSLVLDMDKFLQPAYALVGKFGSETAWICYLLIHAVGVTWRLYNHTTFRPKWELFINGWGFSTWFIVTVSMSLTVNVGLPLSMCIVMLFFSGLAFVRTEMDKKVVSL